MFEPEMTFLAVLREDPVIAWLLFLGLLITIVPASLALRDKMSGRKRIDAENPPVRATKPARFGNQTELVILLLGLLFLLAVIGLFRSIFI